MKRALVATVLLCCLMGCAAAAQAPAGTPAPTAALTAAPPPSPRAPAPAAPTPSPLLLGGQALTGREESLRLVLTAEELKALDGFSNLARLDLSGSTCYDAIWAFMTAHPDVDVRYTVQVGDREVPFDAEELTLAALPEGKALSYLPALKALTVETPLTPDEAKALRALLPAAELSYSLSFAGLTAAWDADALDLSMIDPADVPEAMAALEELPRLKAVRLSRPDESSPWTLQQADELMGQLPALKVDYVAHAFGVSFRLTDPVVSFSGIDLSDQAEELEALLPHLARVGRLDMENCGIPDERMGALREAYPAPKIVWRVAVGAYSCRTDALMIRFSDCIEDIRLHDEDVRALIYCNEIRYLDLGHNYLTSAYFAAYMPELEVCILAVEKHLVDISALVHCPKLEYLEIFSGRVTDLTPLTSCKNLKHLNIGWSPVSDISPLYELDLERLWLPQTRVSSAEVRDFRERFPGCEVNTTANDPAGGPWRIRGNYYTPRYALLREQFCYDHMEINTYSEPPVFE